MNSKRFTLNKKDLKSIVIGAGIAILGALATYITEVIGSIDFGSYTPIAVALASIMVNAIRKYISMTNYR